MSHTAQNIIGLILLASVFVLTRYGIGWRMKRASLRVIQELKSSHARDPATAVALDWAQPNWLKFGLRDFRPGALKAMLANGLVNQTPDGRYYLPNGSAQGKEV